MIAEELQNLQRGSTNSVAKYANDCGLPWALGLHMVATRLKPKINIARRNHFIPEWAEKRNMTQADLVRETGVDKGTVSRWFSGNMPRDKHLDALVVCLDVEEREALFRHPDDDWMARFLRGRPEDEKRRIRAVLLAAFPPKVA
jgi:hypothetical protein